MGRFFKIWPNLSQNWLKFKKILEKIGNFVQNLAQNWANWYMNGLLFLEKLVFVWVYFQIRGGTKTKLEYPPECRHRPILNNGRERNICHSGMKILRVSADFRFLCLPPTLLFFYS